MDDYVTFLPLPNPSLPFLLPIHLITFFFRFVSLSLFYLSLTELKVKLYANLPTLKSMRKLVFRLMLMKFYTRIIPVKNRQNPCSSSPQQLLLVKQNLILTLVIRNNLTVSRWLLLVDLKIIVGWVPRRKKKELTLPETGNYFTSRKTYNSNIPPLLNVVLKCTHTHTHKRYRGVDILSYSTPLYTIANK